MSEKDRPDPIYILLRMEAGVVFSVHWRKVECWSFVQKTVKTKGLDQAEPNMGGLQEEEEKEGPMACISFPLLPTLSYGLQAHAQEGTSFGGTQPLGPRHSPPHGERHSQSRTGGGPLQPGPRASCPILRIQRQFWLRP